MVSLITYEKDQNLEFEKFTPKKTKNFKNVNKEWVCDFVKVSIKMDDKSMLMGEQHTSPNLAIS